jgi:hypothetical protein
MLGLAEVAPRAPHQKPLIHRYLIPDLQPLSPFSFALSTKSGSIRISDQIVHP